MKARDRANAVQVARDVAFTQLEAHERAWRTLRSLLRLPETPGAEGGQDVLEAIVKLEARAEAMQEARDVERGAVEALGEMCAHLRTRLDDAESGLASTTDLANSWARESSVAEARDESGLKGVIDRLWSKHSLVWARAQERDHALYWLLRAYDSGHRKGWEPGPSVAETMERLHDVLCNAGLDPNTPETRAWMKDYEERTEEPK